MSKAGFWEKLDKEWDATNRSAILIRGNGSVQLSAYKVYINQKIHGTGACFADLAPPNSVYSRLPAGAYSVVVRERDARKLDRLESNKLEIELHDDEKILIHFSMNNGRLFLALGDEG